MKFNTSHSYFFDDEDPMYSGKFLNENVVEDGFIMCKRRKGEKDEKYIINQSNSLTLIWLVFLDGI